MRLEHLRVIEDSEEITPGNPDDLLFEAVKELPKEDLARIYNDYATVNFYAPVYINTEENLNKLLAEGKKCSPSFNKDFAFLTCNRYGGIESVDDLSCHSDLKEEIVPFVKDSIENYKDMFIKDALSMEWIKKHLPRRHLTTRNAYIQKVQEIVNYVRNENEELATALNNGPLNKLRTQSKSVYDLEEAEQEILGLFDDYYKGTEADKKGEPLQGDELKQAQEQIFNALSSRYPDTKQFEDLPSSVKQKFAPYFFKESVKQLPNILNRLSGKQNEEADLEGDLKWNDIYEDYEAKIDLIRNSSKVSFLYNKYFPEIKQLYKSGKNDETKTRALLSALISYANKIEKGIEISSKVKTLAEEYGSTFADKFVKAKENEIYEKLKGIKSSDEAKDMVNKYNAVFITFFENLKKNIERLTKDIYSDELKESKDKLPEYKKSVVKEIAKYLSKLLEGENLNPFLNRINKQEFIERSEFKQIAPEFKKVSSKATPKAKPKAKAKAKK